MKKKKEWILGVRSKKFYFYLMFFLSAVTISIFVIVIASYWNNSILNYFISLSASLVAAPVFAYLLDLIVSSFEKRELKRRSSLYLSPISTLINTMIYRILTLKNDNVITEKVNKSEFIDCYQKLFEEYDLLISSIKQNKNDIPTLTEAFNIKNSIEEYSIVPLKQKLQNIFDNEIIIKSDQIISDEIFFLLEELSKCLNDLNLPYLGTKSYDYNESQMIIDWPKSDISPLFKQNYKKHIKHFADLLFDLQNTSKLFNFFINQ